MAAKMLTEADADLLQAVLASRLTRRFASGLNRRQDQTHQDPDDGDHHQ